MALEGNLSAFGLSEILQLIAVQQKTGMLTVSSQNSSAVLFFRDGFVISTRDRRRKARDPFKEYLTRYGILTRDELIKITQISSQSKLDLVDILRSEALMAEDDLLSTFETRFRKRCTMYFRGTNARTSLYRTRKWSTGSKRWANLASKACSWKVCGA